MSESTGDTMSISPMARTVSALVGVILYAAAFLWLGLMTTYAIGIGLLYIVLWEGFFSGFVTGVRMLSIRHYAISLMHGLDERRFNFGTHPALATVVIISIVAFSGLLYLSIRRLRTMDIP